MKYPQLITYMNTIIYWITSFLKLYTTASPSETLVCVHVSEYHVSILVGIISVQIIKKNPDELATGIL